MLDPLFVSVYLTALGLSELPATVDELRQARRKAIAEVHPDRIGSSEVAIEVNTAFEELKKKIESETPVTPIKEKSKVKTEAKKIETELRRASKLYYDTDKDSGLTDDEFDEKKDRLETIDPHNPFLAEVGVEPSSGVWPIVEHVMAMGSQIKITKEEELAAWTKSYTKNSALFWSEKMDGSSKELVYEGGKLIRGSTRGGGTGIKGEDVTPNTFKMQGIPHEISYKGRLGVRAEAMLLLSAFEKLKEQRLKAGEDIPSNPRNAASGIVRRKTGSEECKLIELFSFDALALDDPDYFKTKDDIFNFLKKEGFTVPNHGVLLPGNIGVSSMQAIKDNYENEQRNKLEYQIDGLVVEANDLAVQAELGVTSGKPRAARAYKFSSENAETVLLDVIWQRSRTKINGVAILKRVRLAGANCERASLCNLEEIERLNIQIGSRVLVSRRNDVIPKVEKGLSKGTKDIVPPTECPECNGPTRTDRLWVYCTNPDCSGKASKTIIHYLKALDVKELGDKGVEDLIAKGKLKTPMDLYHLRSSDFKSKKVGDKVLANLRKQSTSVAIYDFVKSFGIELFGRGNTKKVLKVIPTLEGIRNATFEELSDIKGIGDEIATEAIKGLQEHSELMDRLLDGHVTLYTKKTTSNDYLGKTFCFTGVRNKEAEAIIEAGGGTISSSVSSSTSYVVAKDPNSGSSKMSKARKLGIQVMEIDELKRMVGL